MKRQGSLTPNYPCEFSREGVKNVLRGRTIALNDIWATEIYILNFKRTGNDYELEYHAVLWDHFGLDVLDIQASKAAGWGAGFRAWFILQHFRGYKPFIVEIAFTRKLKNTIR